MALWSTIPIFSENQYLTRYDCGGILLVRKKYEKKYKKNSPVFLKNSGGVSSVRKNGAAFSRVYIILQSSESPSQAS